MDTRGPKERAYDERIRPIIDQLMDACEEAQIGGILSLALDDDPQDDSRQMHVSAVMGGPGFLSPMQAVVGMMLDNEDPQPKHLMGALFGTPTTIN